MPIQRLGYQTERQKERARKALQRIPMMIEETIRTIQRYELIDESSIEGMKLIEFREASDTLIDNLTTREDRENGRN